MLRGRVGGRWKVRDSISSRPSKHQQKTIHHQKERGSPPEGEGFTLCELLWAGLRMNRVEQEALGGQREKAWEAKKPPIPVAAAVNTFAEKLGKLSPLPPQDSTTRR